MMTSERRDLERIWKQSGRRRHGSWDGGIRRDPLWSYARMAAAIVVAVAFFNVTILEHRWVAAGSAAVVCGLAVTVVLWRDRRRR